MGAQAQRITERKKETDMLTSAESLRQQCVHRDMHTDTDKGIQRCAGT